jgi:hypothetical protein
MTPWILQNKFLWNEPSLIIIEESNYFYEEYGNFIVIGYNFFSFVNYIQNHLTHGELSILENYKQYNGANKLVYLKNLMESHDDRIYYFFITKNSYNYDLLNDNNFILTLKNYAIDGKNIIYCNDYCSNNKSYGILPYFHKTSAIIIGNSPDINNNNFYFWDHVVNFIKLKNIQLENNSWNFLKEYGFCDGVIEGHDYSSLIFSLSNVFFMDNEFYKKIKKFYPWITGDEELNLLKTLRDDHYQYHTLLWKIIEDPIIIEGNNPQIKPKTKEDYALGWSLSKKNYYIQKKKIIQKNQTNINEFVAPKLLSNPLPWDLFQSNTIQYNLDNIINVKKNSLWLRCLLNYNDPMTVYPETIIFKENGWTGYLIPLENWLIHSHYNHLFVKIMVAIGGCYYVKNKKNTCIFIKKRPSSTINLLIFIVKKYMKNDELDPIIYVFDDNNEIIETHQWTMAGYFIINQIEDQVHQIFI